MNMNIKNKYMKPSILIIGLDMNQALLANSGQEEEEEEPTDEQTSIGASEYRPPIWDEESPFED